MNLFPNYATGNILTLNCDHHEENCRLYGIDLPVLYWLASMNEDRLGLTLMVHWGGHLSTLDPQDRSTVEIQAFLWIEPTENAHM